MSVEALVQAIEAAAAEEVDRLLADADAATAVRVTAAEAAARGRVEAALAAAEPVIFGAEARAVNEARLRLVALRTARLAAATEAAFDLAGRRLATIDTDEPQRWAAAIRELVAEAAALVGSGEISVRPPDLGPAAEALPNPAPDGLTLVADPAMAPGVRGRSADDRVAVDATVPERLRRAREALVPAVAARVREAGEPRALAPAGTGGG